MCFLQFDKNTLTDQALELLSLVPEGEREGREEGREGLSKDRS